MTLFKLIHLLAVLIWVGGLFFAYAVLRPAAAEALPVPQRLKLLDAVLRRFFNWVWGAIGALWVTGFYLIYGYGGIVHAAWHTRYMLVLGVAMAVICGYLFFACLVPFSLHVAKGRWLEAEALLERIRALFLLELALGVLTVCLVAMGSGLTSGRWGQA